MSLLIPSICEENRKPIFNEFLKVQENLGFKLKGFNPNVEMLSCSIDVGKSLGITELNGVFFSFCKTNDSYTISCNDPAVKEKLKYYDKMALIQAVDDFINVNWTTIDYLSLPTASQSQKIKMDFFDRCVAFIGSIVQSDNPVLDYNQKIVQTVEFLFNNMNKKNLHYHNPVHVLCMLDFAKKNNILITKADELAIWFHDAIYWPVTHLKAQLNEQDSANFMKSCLYEIVNFHLLDTASNRILATAKHLEKDVDPQDYTVLDLDLCSFSFEREIYVKASEYIQKEYDFVEKSKFFQGRKNFLQSLISKGFVYRSEAFKKFEAKAQENIRLDLDAMW